MADTDEVGHAVLAVAIKAIATALCVAAGYRGGRIFPVVFIGGGIGLVLHLLIDAIPVYVAVAVGLAAAMATALGTPATAALTAVVILPPTCSRSPCSASSPRTPCTSSATTREPRSHPGRCYGP